MGDAMANLEEMREFQKHWAAYCAGERELTLLKTRPPIDLESLTDADRRLPMTGMPESASFDRHALVAALGTAAVHLQGQDDDAPWGWWLEGEDWSGLSGLDVLLKKRAAWMARLEDLDAQAQAAVDADESHAKALSTMASYAAANAEDRASIQELEERRAHPEQMYLEAAAREGKSAAQGGHKAAYAIVGVAGAAGLAFVPVAVELRALLAVTWLVAVALAYARPWTRPRGWLFKGRRMKDELELIDGKISDAKSRVELRERETKRLDEEAASREAELRAPFEEPRQEACRAVEEAERATIELVCRDVASRDETFEVESLEGVPFEDAFAQLNAREWDHLRAWMSAYVDALPDMVKRAEDVQASELVWLEGHAPFGKRYWPYTDTIVSLMETMRTDKSEAALKRFLHEQAERERSE